VNLPQPVVENFERGQVMHIYGISASSRMFRVMSKIVLCDKIAMLEMHNARKRIGERING